MKKMGYDGLPVYTELTEAQRDAAQEYAGSLGLAFESGYDQQGDWYYVRAMKCDEGAPQWDEAALAGLDEVLA